VSDLSQAAVLDALDAVKGNLGDGHKAFREALQKTNFEGPAPRPMDRAHVELDPEGQIVVDLSHVYKWPKGEPSQFNDPGAIIRG